MMNTYHTTTHAAHYNTRKDSDDFASDWSCLPGTNRSEIVNQEHDVEDNEVSAASDALLLWTPWASYPFVDSSTSSVIDDVSVFLLHEDDSSLYGVDDTSCYNEDELHESLDLDVWTVDNVGSPAITCTAASREHRVAQCYSYIVGDVLSGDDGEAAGEAAFHARFSNHRRYVQCSV